MKLYTKYTMFNLKVTARLAADLGLDDIAKMYSDEEYKAIIQNFTEKYGFLSPLMLMLPTATTRKYIKDLWMFGKNWANRPLFHTHIRL